MQSKLKFTLNIILLLGGFALASYLYVITKRSEPVDDASKTVQTKTLDTHKSTTESTSTLKDNGAPATQPPNPPKYPPVKEALNK